MKVGLQLCTRNMKNSWINSLLMGLMLYLPVHNVLVVLDYELRYDYYSQVMCENRDKPQLACEGKCVLMQKLSLSEQAPEPVEEPTVLPGFPLFFPVVQTAELMGLSSTMAQNHSLQNEALMASPYIGRNYPPPKV